MGKYCGLQGYIAGYFKMRPEKWPKMLTGFLTKISRKCPKKTIIYHNQDILNGIELNRKQPI